MTGQQTLFARVALGLVAGLACVLLLASRRLRTLPRRQFDRLLFGTFAITRLGLFAGVFLVFGIAPRGDVPAYYFEQARQVLHHLVPYRDFVSSYAPLHPYLDAGLITLWHTPLAIMLFSVLVEFFLLPLWLYVGRELLLPEADLRVASLLYLASPISLQFVAIDGQDNVVIAVLLVAAAALLLRSRKAAAGVAFAASIAAVKFLPLLYAPAYVLAMPGRRRFMAAALSLLAAVYGVFLLLHAPILGPLTAEGDLRSAGDLPYVLEAILGITLPARLTDGLLVLVLCALLACIGRAAHHAPMAVRMRSLTFGMAALTLALLLLSKKSWPPYLMLALFPICLLVAQSQRRSTLRAVASAIFGLVAVAEHSYWASSLDQFSSTQFHQALLLHQPDALILLALELLLIAGYAWLLYRATYQLLPSASKRDLHST